MVDLFEPGSRLHVGASELSAQRPEHLQVWLSLFRHTLSHQDNAAAAEALFDVARRMSESIVFGLSRRAGCIKKDGGTNVSALLLRFFLLLRRMINMLFWNLIGAPSLFISPSSKSGASRRTILPELSRVHRVK